MSQLIGPRTREAVRLAPDDDRTAVLLVAQTHAEEVCRSVWPGGTVDPNDMEWTWNDRLRSSAGRFCPSSIDTSRVEFAWGYYRQHGMLELLETVRHELIHAWQWEHPDCHRTGHGPTFRQWVGDLDTSRHCRQW